MDIYSPTGPEFLAAYVPAMLLAGGLSFLLVLALRPQGSRWVPDDMYDLAWLRGGAKGVLEAVLARLFHARAITVGVDGSTFELNADRAAMRTILGHPVERQVFDHLAEDRTTSVWTLESRVDERMAERVSMLRDRGVLMTDARRYFGAALAAVPLFAVGIVGLYRLAHGLTLGRPVGFLIFCEIALMGVLVTVLIKLPRLTRAGQQALDGAMGENAPLKYAGTGGTLSQLDGRDVGLAVALFGLAPLSGTELGPVHRLLHPPSASGGDGGSSCGSSCGGGCGGGCGGCGG